MRALHSRADPAPLIDDPWGDRLVPPEAIDALRERAGAVAGTSDARVDAHLRASAAYTSVITRARFAEDALHAAVARGATQYVIVGAGFDSDALRAIAACAAPGSELVFSYQRATKRALAWCGPISADSAAFGPMRRSTSHAADASASSAAPATSAQRWRCAATRVCPT